MKRTTSKKTPAGKPAEGTSDYAKKARSGNCMYRGNQLHGGPSCRAHLFDVGAFYRRRDAAPQPRYKDAA